MYIIVAAARPRVVLALEALMLSKLTTPTQPISIPLVGVGTWMTGRRKRWRTWVAKVRHDSEPGLRPNPGTPYAV